MGADETVEVRTMSSGSGRPPVALPREQRRARGIAMGKAELDAFLTEQRTCRVATAGQDGPHLTPLWYVWDEAALWLYSVVRSQRWTDIGRDRRGAAFPDAARGRGRARGGERGAGGASWRPASRT